MNSTMTILQVISQRHLSGAERVCLMLSESLQRRGHRVILLCKKDQDMLAEAEQRGIETRTPGLSGKFNPLVALGILRNAREVGADIIHTHLSTASQWGGVAGRLGGIPVVSHVHAMNSRYFFMLADAMVACSEGVRQHIIGQGVSSGRIETIYNGIESKRLVFADDAVTVRSSLGIAADTPAIACIAHLADKKGQADLIRAVALLGKKWPDLHCFLVGTGENMDSLRRLAEESGVAQRAILLGYRSDAVAIMNAMDCIMLPSLGKEGLPLVLLEAALLGKPAICSNIPGNNEVVLDGATGLLFPPGDAAALADRIDRILSSSEQRGCMGSAARERAKREFTIEAMTERVELLYRRLISKGAAS
jgi:glycosyltransferase involved in cell wall biosynthesis